VTREELVQSQLGTSSGRKVLRADKETLAGKIAAAEKYQAKP